MTVAVLAGILTSAMYHRVATLLLSTAVILAGVVAGPCTSTAACAFAPTRDCCNARGAGISTPRCCDGQQQARSTPPATAERQTHQTLTAPAMQVATVAVAPAGPAQPATPQRIDAAAPPPGGTLIGQYTSLLL